MTNVLVLGAGPAGLMAAEAAQQVGARVRIASRIEPSVIGGAQYLHEPILGINSPVPDGFIRIKKVGTAEGYARKVYDDPTAPTSWRKYTNGQELPAWDLRRTYEQLRERWLPSVWAIDLNAETLQDLEEDGAYDIVISSVPRPVLCRDRALHTFTKQKVLIDMDSPVDGENVIIWNGDPEVPWYRASKIFEVTGGYEYPLGAVLAGAHVARKPLRTTCDCWPEVLRVGRYGIWDKNVLTHDAYWMTKSALHAL